jgi:hypothetical protein
MAEPPHGQLRHTIDPPNIHSELIAVGVSTTIIAFVAVVLRMFTRAHVTNNGVNLDDCKLPPQPDIEHTNYVHTDMVICAMVLSFVLLGCNFPRKFSKTNLSCKAEHSADMGAGLGYHIWDVKTESFVSPFQKASPKC